MTPKIKICGIGSSEDARVAEEAGATFVGIVQAPNSPRTKSPEDIAELVVSIDSMLSTVAVFVNPTHEEVRRCPTDFIQLHGTESAEDVSRLAAAGGKPIIKAISFDEQMCKEWDAHPAVSMLLVDGPDAGSGAPFDHALLAELIPELTKPLIVAGGLDPENVRHLLDVAKPYAVDVSSGVERTRGTKDHGLIRAFCQAVQQA